MNDSSQTQFERDLNELIDTRNSFKPDYTMSQDYIESKRRLNMLHEQLTLKKQQDELAGIKYPLLTKMAIAEHGSIFKRLGF